MFKSFQDTSALQQFHAFPNLNMQQATSAYGFSGVTFWLDAAYGLNTQTNLGAVSSWQARVGGATFEQATAAAQPRLILSDSNYNNLPSVETISSARFMLSSSNGFQTRNLFTLAVISKVNTQNTQNSILALPGGFPSISDGGSASNVTGFGAFSSQNGVLFQGTTESTAARIKIISSYAIVVNGVVENTSGGFSQNNEFKSLFRAGGGVENLIGTIAEIIGFSYAMTSDECVALSNNINQKYALY